MTLMFIITVGSPESGVASDSAFFEMFITMLLTVFSSSAIGIVVSAISKNSDKAMTTAPFLLIIQLLFSGILFELKGATEKISKLMTNIQSHMTSNVCSITQYAAVEALNGPQDKVKEMISEFERRRNYMVKTLEEMNNLSIIKPQGAFYIMINIDKCLGKEINGEKITDSMDFSAKLLEHEKVAVIPGKAFGLDNYVRVSYATSMELIEKGLERINKFVNKLK